MLWFGFEETFIREVLVEGLEFRMKGIFLMC